jgi:hypothetical protein
MRRWAIVALAALAMPGASARPTASPTMAAARAEATDVPPRSEAFVFDPRTTPWTAEERRAPAELEPGQRIALRPGAWLGEVELFTAWRDFRDQEVAAGRYELCYALQPRLKEHAGVDAIRDFGLLVARPAAAGRGCLGDWLAASRRVSGTGHPAVIALIASDAVTAWSRDRPTWRLLETEVGGVPFTIVTSGHVEPTEAF